MDDNEALFKSYNDQVPEYDITFSIAYIWNKIKEIIETDKNAKDSSGTVSFDTMIATITEPIEYYTVLNNFMGDSYIFKVERVIYLNVNKNYKDYNELISMSDKKSIFDINITMGFIYHRRQKQSDESISSRHYSKRYSITNNQTLSIYKVKDTITRKDFENAFKHYFKYFGLYQNNPGVLNLCLALQFKFFNSDPETALDKIVLSKDDTNVLVKDHTQSFVNFMKFNNYTVEVIE